MSPCAVELLYAVLMAVGFVRGSPDVGPLLTRRGRTAFYWFSGLSFMSMAASA